MNFQDELHDILLDYMNEDENIKIRKQIMSLINKVSVYAQTDIVKNEDFMLEDIPKYRDGIRWFTQEYLAKHE